MNPNQKQFWVKWKSDFRKQHPKAYKELTKLCRLSIESYEYQGKKVFYLKCLFENHPLSDIKFSATVDVGGNGEQELICVYNRDVSDPDPYIVHFRKTWDIKKAILKQYEKSLKDRISFFLTKQKEVK